ncbi:MAG: alpha/beta fold hydrolase [Roseivirga sp.]
MPIIPSSYKGPPFYLINGHFETVVPSLKRKIEGVVYERERIETPDDDFLDIDWVKTGNDKLLLISHGLEGNTDRHYVLGLAKLFNQHGWDIVAWNNRTCSGEMNRQRIMYHHGASYDLRTVVEHINRVKDYQRISLAGISMGGGQTLRFMGEHEEHPLASNIHGAAVISAPCSLLDSVTTLAKRSNWIYEKKFLDRLKVKVRKKAEQFPDIDVSGLDRMKKLKEFDDAYSGPLHGLKDAQAFYEYCSPFPYVKKINQQVLILNALNDPLLEGDCYPHQIAEAKDNLYLEMPKRGGHVGFMIPGEEFAYSEQRALEFLQGI